MKHVISKVTKLVVATTDNVAAYDADLHDFVDDWKGGAIGDYYDGEAFHEAGTAKDVKLEAARRIEEIAPLWKQVNAAGDAIALIKKREDGNTLTDAENAKLEAYLTIKAAVDAIREKSDAIEMMSPIPGDFRDSKYWI